MGAIAIQTKEREKYQKILIAVFCKAVM